MTKKISGKGNPLSSTMKVVTGKGMGLPLNPQRCGGVAPGSPLLCGWAFGSVAAAL